MTKPITPLRQRMLDDMKIRNMSPLTQAAYVERSPAFVTARSARSDPKAK